MRKSVYTIFFLLIVFLIQIPAADAIDRVQTLYPGDPGTITILNDNPAVNPVPVVICANAENAMGMQGRTKLGYRGVTYLETAWAWPGMSQVVNGNVPAVVLQNGYWICDIMEINQPGGSLVYKFYY